MENSKEKALSENSITRLDSGRSSTKATSLMATNTAKESRSSTATGIKALSKWGAGMDLGDSLTSTATSMTETLRRDFPKVKDSNSREE